MVFSSLYSIARLSALQVLLALFGFGAVEAVPFGLLFETPECEAMAE